MDLSKYKAEREELVDQEVAMLLSSSGELNPFKKEHIYEALMEMGDEKTIGIAELCERARLPYQIRTTNQMEVLGRAIWCNIYEYWENIATSRAEIKVPSAHEIYTDEHADSLNARMDSAKDVRLGL